MDLDLITYRAQQIGVRQIGNRLNNEIIVLMDYEFNCSVSNITSVILGINVRLPTKRRTLFPTLQLWRHATDHQYVKAHERIIYYSTFNISTNGVFEYPLEPPILANGGDLLAVSQGSEGDSIVRLYQINGVSFKTHKLSVDTTDAILATPTNTDRLILVYPVTDGNCVLSPVNRSVIKQYALSVHETVDVMDRKQYIYPEIKFTCNGSITKWIYSGKIHQILMTENEQQPELQIWQQKSNSEYYKTRFTLVDELTMIDTNLYEFTPQTPLEFQEGDLFGLYMPRKSESRFILNEQKESGPINLQVGGHMDANTPLSTITETLMTNGNDFPLVTVEISSSSSLLLLPSILSSASSILSSASSSSLLSSSSLSSSILSIQEDISGLIVFQII
jgi:hypothetical protein